MLAYLSKMAVRFVRNVRHFANAQKATNVNRLITKTLRVLAIFAGMDLAEALGYAKPQNALLTHVDKEDMSTAPIQGTGLAIASARIGRCFLWPKRRKTTVAICDTDSYNKSRAATAKKDSLQLIPFCRTFFGMLFTRHSLPLITHLSPPTIP